MPIIIVKNKPPNSPKRLGNSQLYLMSYQFSVVNFLKIPQKKPQFIGKRRNNTIPYFDKLLLNVREFAIILARGKNEQ